MEKTCETCAHLILAEAPYLNAEGKPYYYQKCGKYGMVICGGDTPPQERISICENEDGWEERHDTNL